MYKIELISELPCTSYSSLTINFYPLYILGLIADSSVGKESAFNAGDAGLIPGSGRSPGEGIGYLFQYSWASLMVSW